MAKNSAEAREGRIKLTWASDLTGYKEEIVFVFILGIASFFYLSLLAFDPSDTSFITATYPEIKPANLGGKYGAEISAFSIYYFGIASYLIPLPFLFYFGTNIFTSGRTANPRLAALGWVFLIIASATIASASYELMSYSGYYFEMGGTLGGGLNSFLQNSIGEGGHFVLNATLIISALILIVQKNVLALIKPKIASTSSKVLKSPTKIKLSPIAAAFNAMRSKHKENKEIKEKEKLELAMEKARQPQIKEETQDESIPLSGALPFFPEAPKKEPMVDGPSPVEDTPYEAPSTDLFKQEKFENNIYVSKEELEQTAKLIVQTFSEFGVAGNIINYQSGPVVTVYEFQPDAGVKQSKVIGLMDDLALSLRVDSIFINPVKGKRALGIQVPNTSRQTVYLGDILSAKDFKKSKSPLTFGMGKSLSGDPVSANLNEMPHLLVAGATGAGKSVGINSLLCSIIMKSSPKDVRMILVDPKMLELSIYEGIPHLLMPVITESSKASIALKWTIREMERRYSIMQHFSVRNVESFNEAWSKKSAAEKHQAQNDLQEMNLSRMPYIMLVIDELADLMLTAPKEIESMIQRLAQKARASGIHMVLATQRPSVDVITGVIKANLPSRISYQVVSKHDSRTILDKMGAEKLLGKGDFLFQRPGISNLERIQGAFVSDEEVFNLVAKVKTEEMTNYDETAIKWVEEEAAKAEGSGLTIEGVSDDDPKFAEALAIAQKNGKISASFLQRQLKIGYNRAARMVESMAEQGLVGEADGSKPREWLG